MIDIIIQYITVYVSVAIINMIPAFMPPTWIILSLYKIHNNNVNTLLLALVGALGSTTGRIIMYKYSSLARRFMSKERIENLDDLKNIISKNWKEVFTWSFIFSLSPFPSNLLFIGGGITNVDLIPLALGFMSGRFISYSSMIFVSSSVFTYAETIYDNAKVIFDILGILLSIGIIFIDWDKTIDKMRKIRRYHFTRKKG